MLLSLNRLQYSVYITFIYTENPKKMHDSLYCNICLIIMIWNRPHNTLMIWRWCCLSNTKSLVLIPDHALKTTIETQDPDSVVLPQMSAAL